jgi:ligand-binding sensor domain-containing protein
MIKYILIGLLISFNIVFAQFKPGNFYLSGERKLSKTVDENPSSNSISDLITIGDTVWVGTGSGVSLSTDRGNNWTNFNNTPAFGTESASAIAYDKGVFFAATAHSTDQSGTSYPEGSGLRFTTNNGLTWTTIPEPVDPSGDSSVIYGINHLRAVPVTVKIQNLIYDIAITHTSDGKPVLWIATFAGGLRRSFDMGSTWQRVVIPPDNLSSIKPTDTLNFCLSPVGGKICSDNNLNYRVFSVISVNDSTVYVGSAGGINKTTNAQDSFPSWVKFTHLNQSNPISGNFVVALQNNNGRVWGATWKAEGQTESYAVSMTSDGGTTWETFLDGEKAHNFGNTRFGDIIALTDDGAFRSSNFGVSWVLPNKIIDDQSKLALATSIFYAAASSGNDVWLGSSDGLAKLTEGFGTMWQGKWKIYFASQKLASSRESYAYPNPFSPRTDVLKIKYSTGGKNSQVTIRIFDFGMNYVRTVIQNATRGNPVHVIDSSNPAANGVIDNWDGKDERGNIVPNGVYFYRIEVDSDNPVYGKILVLQ